MYTLWVNTSLNFQKLNFCNGLRQPLNFVEYGGKSSVREKEQVKRKAHHSIFNEYNTAKKRQLLAINFWERRMRKCTWTSKGNFICWKYWPLLKICLNLFFWKQFNNFNFFTLLHKLQILCGCIQQTEWLEIDFSFIAPTDSENNSIHWSRFLLFNLQSAAFKVFWWNLVHLSVWLKYGRYGERLALDHSFDSFPCNVFFFFGKLLYEQGGAECLIAAIGVSLAFNKIADTIYRITFKNV